MCCLKFVRYNTFFFLILTFKWNINSTDITAVGLMLMFVKSYLNIEFVLIYLNAI